MSTIRTEIDHAIDPEITTDPNVPKVTMYCLKTCSTCKRASAELDGAGVHVTMRDVRAKDMGLEDFQYLEGKVGWEALVNKQSRTWRELPDDRKASLDRDSALELLVEKPTLMKRPAIDCGDEVHLGWTDATRDALFAKLGVSA